MERTQKPPARVTEPSAEPRGLAALFHRVRRRPRPSRRVLLSLLLLGSLGALLGIGLATRGDDRALLDEVRARIADERDGRLITRAGLLASPADFRGQGGSAASDGGASITTGSKGGVGATEIFGSGWSRHLWSAPNGPLYVGRADASGNIDWRRFGRGDWSALQNTPFGVMSVGDPAVADPLALARRLLASGCLNALRLPDGENGQVVVGLVLCDSGLLRELTGDVGAGLAMRLYFDRSSLEIRASELELRYPDGRWSNSRLDLYPAVEIPTPLTVAATANESLATWLGR